MITVRYALDGDGEVLAGIDLSTWNEQTSPVPRPVAGYRFFTKDVRPPDVLVAMNDGVVCGYVKLHDSDDPSSRAHVIDIKGLAVERRQQGTGVGMRLLEAAVEESRRRGVRKVALRVLEHNWPARRLYERGGFLVEGVLRDEFHLAGRYVDDVMMARHVEPVAT